jgi:Domain of unknown function (DUF4345)
MNALVRHSVWFGRLVLVGATLLFVLIGIRYVFDPIGAVAPHQIALGSQEAVTNIRVSGGVFLGIAAVLFACALSERRILAGTGVLALVSIAVTAARLFGLAVDGPAPFTVHVLKPELSIVILSTVGFILEVRRSRHRVHMPAPLQERLA